MIKVPDEIDQVAVSKAYVAEQAHVFRFWDRLDEAERRQLLDQLREIDFQQLGRLTKLIDQEPPVRQDVTPVAAVRVDAPERRAALAELGWEALRAGRVALLMVAGGQGTRLGWDAPKGTYPVGPCTDKSLYQLFAEQVLALGRRAGHPLRWYVMTSRQNRDATEAFFREHDFFGLDAQQVTFLVQRELPNADFRGKLVLSTRSQVAMSPNGHGGALRALIDAGALDELREAGVEQLFYWQVDNPLCPVADPVFLGAHLEAGAEASTKVVRKTDPAEKVGVVAEREGRTTVVEYSDMTADQQAARDEESGELLFRAGSIAIHLFGRAFLERIADEVELEHHLARKTVPCVDEAGDPAEPTEPNVVKFETFIFDVLPHAEGHVTFEIDRTDEFEPLKNAEGPYSPATVRAALSERAARWLADAGQPPARDAEGELTCVCEVSPLTALDPEALKAALADRPAPGPQDGKLSV